MAPSPVVSQSPSTPNRISDGAIISANPKLLAAVEVAIPSDQSCYSSGRARSLGWASSAAANDRNVRTGTTTNGPVTFPGRKGKGKRLWRHASPFQRRVRQIRSFIKEKSQHEPEPEPYMNFRYLRNDIGAMKKPIYEFRPQVFRYLDPDRPVIHLDLFWPISAEDMEDAEEENSDGDLKGVFPLRELEPLVSFRNIHVLHLSGMMRSYQTFIWQVCWVNKNLTQLTLDMALEPEFNAEVASQYRKIDETWFYDGSKPTYTEPTEYLGSHGTGELHEEFGSGEYLDRNAMRQAQLAVATELPTENLRYLPLHILTLTNVAVDAGPFFRWFDPDKVKEVTFKSGCFDTGFYLPDNMRNSVLVSGPQRPKKLEGATRPDLGGSMVIKPGDLKVVTLKKGQVVKREDWDGKNHLPDEAKGEGVAQATTASGSGAGEKKGLKHKVSQMMGLGKKGAKE